jgi:hypothetical protein
MTSSPSRRRNKVAKILIYSIPFGFGPTGKALVIANHLRVEHEVTLASFAQGYELICRSAAGLDTVDMHSREIANLHHLFEQGVDVFVSIMDLRIVRSVKHLSPKTKVVFVDSLLSWRLQEYSAQVLSDADAVDLYVAQYDYGLDSASLIEKFGANLEKLHIVRPLLNRLSDEPGPSTARDGLIIHLGGVGSPVIAPSEYVPFIRQTAATLLSHVSSARPIIVASGPHLASLLSMEFLGISHARIECMAYDQFQHTIASAALVVTTPGIETAYESFLMGRPVAFLPPLNSTQLHQLKGFRAAGLTSVVPANTWARLNQISIAQVPYRMKTSWLCDLANELAAEDGYHAQLCDTVDRLLSVPEEVARLCCLQERFVPEEMQDGLQIIAKYVNAIESAA